MYRQLGFIAITSVMMLTACRSSSAGEANRGIGDPCRKNSDCISGAFCKFSTCDFVAPCSSTTTRADGNEEVAYAFDAKGRELGFTRTQDGKVTTRQVVTWSADGRTSHWQMWTSDAPDAKPEQTWTETYDEAGDLTKVVESYPDGETNETRYTWSNDWACRASVAEMTTSRGTSVTRSTCDDAGNPVRSESTEDGVIRATREYTYVAGRMATRVLTLINATIPPLRMAVDRDPRGAMSRLRFDNDDDGVFETTETYDLGCWDVKDNRVVYTKP